MTECFEQVFEHLLHTWTFFKMSYKLQQKRKNGVGLKDKNTIIIARHKKCIILCIDALIVIVSRIYV